MAVPIRFEPDMSRVRKAIDDIVAEAQAKSIGINLTGGGGGGGAAGGGGATRPSAAGVFSGSQHLLAGAFGSVGGGMTVPGFAAPFASPGFFNAGTAGTGGVGQALAMLGYGGANAAASTLPVNAAASAAAAGSSGGLGVAVAGGAIGGLRGANVLGIPLTGLTRFAGAGFLLREAGHLLQGAGDYMGQMDLSGGDQLAQYKAGDTLRQLGKSIPVVGEIGGFIADPFGINRYRAEATIRQASATDQKTDMLRSFGFVARGAAREAQLSGVHQPAARALEKLNLDYEAATQSTDQLGRELAAKDEESNIATRAAQATARNRFFADRYTISAERARDEAANAITKIQQASARGNVLNPIYNSLRIARDNAAEEVLRGETFLIGNILAGSAADIEEAGFSGRGNPYAAARVSLLESNQSRLAVAYERRVPASVISALTDAGKAKLDAFDADYARTVGAASANLAGVALIQTAIAARDPLGAQIAGIEAKLNTDLQNPLVRNNRTLRVATQANALRETVIAVNEFNRTLGGDINEIAGATVVANLILARKPLDAQVRAILNRRDRAIFNDPRAGPGSDIREAYYSEADAQIRLASQEYNDVRRYRRNELLGEQSELQLAAAYRPAAGRATREAAQAKNDAQKLRDQDDAANANLVVSNAILRQQAIRKQIFQSFEAVEVDARRTAFGGPRGGEDQAALLKKIDENITGLRSDLDGGVGRTGN